MVDPSLLEVRFDNFNYIFRGLFGRFRVSGHVVADMVLHELRHEAVDGPSRSSETLENIRAMLIFVETALDAFQLADDLLGSVDQIEFFARSM